LNRHITTIALLIAVSFSCVIDAKISILPSSEKEALSQEILIKITNDHFFKDGALENLNLQLVDALLDYLDSRKIYFTAYEIKQLKKKIDPRDNQVDLQISYELINLYYNRLLEATEYQSNILQRAKFSFTSNEEMVIEDDLKKWPRSKFELKQTWKQVVKNDVLNSLLSEKDLDEAKNNIAKRYKNRVRRISQRNEEDIFSMVMNNITGLFDPHSSYFSPKSAEDFEMTMSLRLEGIGALLTTEDDYPIIVSVVPGGPAEKSGRINADDRIVKIKQVDEDDSASIDVVGWRVDEVVQLIRGKSGTKVELELIPANNEDYSERKWVTLIREEVKLEEQAAKSKIIEVQNGTSMQKIGIIDLPTFYIDFSAWRRRDPDYKSSSKDVEDLLVKFNNAEVDAVIIDLRGNSGGSLFEANRLTGLFVGAGATLQVKESDGSIRPWGDSKAKQVWKKPMVVLVDRYSASASEIFAGAIQDYQRGLIVGHRTFGKGTVQKLDTLSSGQLKLTESKFYRITGSGTQAIGVSPDISLPSAWDNEEIGESALPSSLPWDKIKPIQHKKFQDISKSIGYLKGAHEARIELEPNLKYILDIRERYENQKNKTSISLNLKQREKEKIDRQAWTLVTENKRRLGLSLEIFSNYEELKNFNEGAEPEDIDLDSDYLLNETTKVVTDYLAIEQLILISEAA